jgi:predicted nucleic acid-binding protein
MIAIDTNILIYAHRPEAPFHLRAKEAISRLATAGERYAIPFHCVVEFAGIVSHPKIWAVPSTAQQIQLQVEAWLEPGFAWLLVEEPPVMRTFFSLLAEGKVVGGSVHDARIASCCLFHGVKTLWSADRDFSRYAQLNVKNPLV